MSEVASYREFENKARAAETDGTPETDANEGRTIMGATAVAIVEAAVGFEIGNVPARVEQVVFGKPPRGWNAFLDPGESGQKPTSL